MSSLGRVVGAASVITGTVGALALGGITAQRRAVRRYHRLADDGEVDFDSLIADRTYTVVSADGLALHVEEVGPADAPLTVVFAHGWTLRSGAWHYQRLGLSGPGFGAGGGPEARLVFYDQRSHGRSSRADTGRSTLAALAEDLSAVIGTAAPTGPLVLVGHSMGGMALLALAAAEPELIAERLSGFALIDSSAYYRRGDASRPATIGTQTVVRTLSATASRFPRLLERGRPAAKEAVWLLTRNYGFAAGDISVHVVDYLDRMVTGTPVEVIGEFLPVIAAHDVRAGLPVLADIPGVVICGEHDRLTPPAQSQALAAELTRSELVIVPDGGHNIILERPGPVNDALRNLLRHIAIEQRIPDAALVPKSESESGSTPGSESGSGTAPRARAAAGVDD